MTPEEAIEDALYELATHQDDYDGKGRNQRVVQALATAGYSLVLHGPPPGWQYEGQPQLCRGETLWRLTKITKEGE